MLKAIGVVLVLVVLAVVAVVVLAARQPGAYRVERSTVIAAPPGRILPLLTDFHRFREWSPWEKLDPNAAVTYSGAPSGTGAVYEWSGNSKAGQGRMEIVSVTSTQVPAQVGVQLDFIKPFKSSNTVTYTLAPEGAGTRVTWSMSGPMMFMSKVMTVFSPMDKMIGPDFENGLANLKRVAEATPAT